MLSMSNDCDIVLVRNPTVSGEMTTVQCLCGKHS